MAAPGKWGPRTMIIPTANHDRSPTDAEGHTPSRSSTDPHGSHAIPFTRATTVTYGSYSPQQTPFTDRKTALLGNDAPVEHCAIDKYGK